MEIQRTFVCEKNKPYISIIDKSRNGVYGVFFENSKNKFKRWRNGGGLFYVPLFIHHF